jgi:hypothetical protein
MQQHFYADEDTSVVLYNKYVISGIHLNSVRAHTKIVKAIQNCTTNKYHEGRLPGAWCTWICNDAVYGEQMQTQFCLRCGEYKFLTYYTSQRERQAPSEPYICYICPCQ